MLEYAYGDVVRLAGHSCPTVASAYLMTRAALRALYPDTLPERGGLRVELAGERAEGVNGVVGNVASFITGAAGDTGFKGIGGHFVRRDLFRYGATIDGEMRFTRIDTGAGASVSARLERVPSDPRIGRLLPRCITGAATPDEATLFGSLWQLRVRALLLEHADDPQTFVVARGRR